MLYPHMVNLHGCNMRHEFEQAPGVGDGQEVWHAAVHRVAKSQHDCVTELKGAIMILTGIVLNL